jgi:hypothetical protein
MSKPDMEKKAIVKLEERQIDNYKRTEVVGKFLGTVVCRPRLLEEASVAEIV